MKLTRARGGHAVTIRTVGSCPNETAGEGRSTEPAAERLGHAEQPDPTVADSSARIEARRLDSYANLVDSNDARGGKLTPAEIQARVRKQKQRAGLDKASKVR